MIITSLCFYALMGAGYFIFKGNDSPKVILIGMDGADWGIIDQYIAEGKLPNFKRFKEEGAWGKLRSYSPMLSPVLWTTVATGKSPDEHGVVDFLEWDEVQKTRIPVTSDRVKVRPIWDILGEKGHTVGIFNWLISWPAQKVNGVLVSDRLGYHIFPHIVGDRLKVSQLAWPTDYVFKRQHLITSPSEITYEQAMPFVHVKRGEFERSFRKGRYDIRNPQYNLRMILSSKMTMFRLALESVERKQPDFLALYFDAPDTMMHTYMDYAPPKLDRISQSDFDRYKDAVEQSHIVLDRMLGDFLKEADPDTTFILVSDHGFKSGDERPEKSAVIGGNAEEIWHNPEGIIAFLGPQFEPGKEIKGYNLYDITPTLLYLFGQPLAEDMKGGIMTSAFRQEMFDIERIDHVASYENGESRQFQTVVRSTVDSSSNDLLKERLVSLGYINQGELVPIEEVKKKKTQPKSHFDTRNPLLEAYHLEEAGKKDEAMKLYKEILRENPGYKNAYKVHNQLALLYKDKERYRRALNHIRKAIRKKPELGSLYVNRGNIQRDMKRFHKAMKSYKKALKLNPFYMHKWHGLLIGYF